MRTDILELDAAVSPHLDRLRLELGDVEALRLLLGGGSVIDWHKAAFSRRDQVDRLLGLHLFDLHDPTDQRRLRYVYQEAVAWVEEFLGRRLPPELRTPDDVREVFLTASDTRGFRRRQMYSCMVLKLMHVIHHLECADLKMKVPTSEQALLDLAHASVCAHADRMRTAGPPLVAFYGNRKTRKSVIAKLLQKRDNVAVTIFDKLRYRLVVPEREHLAPALRWLTHHVFPFNHTIPGQTHNNLLDPRTLARHLGPGERESLQPLVDDPIRSEDTTNEFSGSTYRMINFVADLPVRLPDDVVSPDLVVQNGRVVFVLVEFQLVDEETARNNELGENAHHHYKARQHERVHTRLIRGQYHKVPPEDAG